MNGVRLCADPYNGFSILLLRADDWNITRLVAILSGQFKIYSYNSFVPQGKGSANPRETAIFYFSFRKNYRERGRNTLNTVKLDLGTV